MLEINNLSAVNYKFKIDRIPEIEYRIQDVALPSVSLGSATIPTPFTEIPTPGNLSFDDLNISFIVGESMADYLSVLKWMLEIGQPEKIGFFPNGLKNQFSDASLIVCNSSFTPIFSYNFIDLFPTNISSLQFTTTTTNVQYIHASASFKYTRFEIQSII